MLTPRLYSPYNCGIVSAGDTVSLTLTRRGAQIKGLKSFLWQTCSGRALFRPPKKPRIDRRVRLQYNGCRRITMAERVETMPEQKALSEMTELKKCLRKLDQTEEGYYKVSSLPELAAVLRKLQEEKARQGGVQEQPKRKKR